MIIRLVFRNTPAMMRTLVRFQEFYESPYVRGDRFTLDELEDVYVTQKGRGLEKEYYTKWHGCNFPGIVAEAFRDGAMGPLLAREHAVMAALPDDAKNAYYVIASAPRQNAVILHERGHALFWLDDTYRKTALNVVQLMPPGVAENIKKELTEWGYSDTVLKDEIAAYLLDGSLLSFKSVPRDTHIRLRGLRKQLLRSYKQRIKLYKERVVRL